MTDTLPSLAAAEWLKRPGVRAIFAALDQGGDTTRVIGGAVRNALLGIRSKDIDFATTATPDVVAQRAEAAGIKAVPTGVEHGTLTLVSGGVGHQVTTLREDIQTDGRHAIVRFGRDWLADARRRDFTLNALSVDAEGMVHDPIGGYADLQAGRIRFIGDADQRIAEDHLRILRFFRFQAECGKGPLDREGLSAAIRRRDDLRDLSAERVGQEVRRLAVAARALETLTIMQEAGILPIVLAGVGYLGPFKRLIRFEAAAGVTHSLPLRLAALGVRVEEDVVRLADRLRLTNAWRDRMFAALGAARSFGAEPDARSERRLLYELGPEAYGDGISLALAWGVAEPEDRAWLEHYRLPGRWQRPRFPLKGRDVIGAGTPRGPAVGALLEAVEAWWIERDFAPDAAELRTRLQQMIAAEQ